MGTLLPACAGMLLMANATGAGPGGTTQPANPLDDGQIRQRILTHRTAEATVTVVDNAGRPLADRAITVRQVRHKFLFGCNAYMLDRCQTAADNDAYKRRFAGLLNYATLGFYWGAYEPREGQTRREQLAAAARWCSEQSIRTKGHPLLWHQVVPRWLAEKAPEQVEALQFARISREVKGFAGSIDTWDVVNEAVVMPDFREPNGVSQLCKRLGRVGLLKRAFDQARQASPKAVLVLNDFDTSPKYERLIQECIDAGVPFDLIGIQSHMHVGYWGAAKAWQVCERFARFGRPLHFTELTILSGRLKTDSDWQGHHPGWDSTPEGETRQAEQAAELYRILFSHPAVQAITWWDFSDQGAWQGAPAGLVRKDMTAKPAYEALVKLIRGEWWTGPAKLTTDANGKVTFRGFLGDYVVESPAGEGEFRLDRPGRCEAVVTVK